MAFCEVSQDQSPGTPAAAGDFGFKVLTSSDPAEKTKKLQLGRCLECACPLSEIILWGLPRGIARFRSLRLASPSEVC